MAFLPGGNILELQESGEVLLCHDAAVPWGSEIQIAESVCELSQEQAHTHTHISVHQQRYILKLREVHNAFCLVPLAAWELRLSRTEQFLSTRATAPAHP